MSRYQNRTYDTCIDIGNEGVPWCPTLLDGQGNYIEGFREPCLPTCDVNNCPIGFYLNVLDHTCYHFSSNIINKTEKSYADAQEKCRFLGATLWEPRVREAQSMLQGVELNPGHFHDLSAYTMIGIQ